MLRVLRRVSVHGILSPRLYLWSKSLTPLRQRSDVFPTEAQRPVHVTFFQGLLLTPGQKISQRHRHADRIPLPVVSPEDPYVFFKSMSVDQQDKVVGVNFPRSSENRTTRNGPVCCWDMADRASPVAPHVESGLGSGVCILFAALRTVRGLPDISNFGVCSAHLFEDFVFMSVTSVGSIGPIF